MLALLLMLCLTSTLGCKTTEWRIVYVSFEDVSEAAQGAIKIATNEKVPVTIEGKEDVYTTLDLAGRYVVSGSDLKAFVEAVRKTRESP